MCLAEILDLGQSLQWWEAVAFARELCDALLSASIGPAEPMVNPGSIHVLPEGRIRIDPGSLKEAATGAEAVASLGRVINALVAVGSMPVQLRLTVLSAVSPTPVFATIREFSDALGYFERPDRTARLREARDRWTAAVAAARAAQPEGALLPDTDDDKGPERPSRRRQRTVALAVIGAVVVFGVVVGAWLTRNPSARSTVDQQVERASTIATRTIQRTGEAIASAAVTARDYLTGTSPVPAAPPTAAMPKPVVRRSTRGPGEGGRGPAARSTDPKPGQAGPPYVTYDLANPNAPASPGPASPAPGSPEPAVPPSEMARTTPADRLIYTSAQPGLELPVPVRPKFATELPPDVRADELCAIDLIISETGEVEAIKLVPLPQDVRAMMLVSAAKAWRFKPAMYEGKPVRFFKRLWVNIR